MSNHSFDANFPDQQFSKSESDLSHSNGHFLISISTKKQLSDYLEVELKRELNYSLYFLLTLDIRAKRSIVYLTDMLDENHSIDSLNLINPAITCFYNQIISVPANNRTTEIDLTSFIAEMEAIPFVEKLINIGIQKILPIPINLNNQPNGALFLLYSGGRIFHKSRETMFTQMPTQISRILAGLYIIEEARKSEFEKDLLFSIFNDLNSLADKSLVISTIYERLKVLLPMNDIMITLMDPDRKQSYLFLEKFELGRKDHPDFNQLFRLSAPFNDGIIDEIISKTEALNIAVDDPMFKGKAFADFYEQTGIRQIAGIAMKSGVDTIGVLYVTSDTEIRFSVAQLRLFKAISIHLSLILSNLQAKENIAERKFQKAALLELSNEIALVTDKDRLLLALQLRIKKLIPFNDIIITLYNNQTKTHAAFIFYSEDKRAKHPDFEEARLSHSPIGDGVVSRTMESSNPVIFQIEELSKKPNAPVYVKFYSKSGIEEFVGVSMRNKDGIFGGLYLFSEQRGTYHPKQFNLIRQIANQLSITVANVLAYEEIVIREKEKSILLTLSNHMAIVKKREDLLRVLHECMNAIFYFDHVVLTLIDSNKLSYADFSYGPQSKCEHYADHEKILQKGYSLYDSLMQEVLKSSSPVVFNIEDLLQNDDCPDYIHLNYDCGMREIMYAQLHSGDKLLGFLILLSDIPNSFTSDKLNLIQGICYQLSSAVANIEANDDIILRDQEKSILLATSNDLAAVRNKMDFHKVVNTRLKSLLSFSHILVMQISRDEKLISPFLLDPESKCIGHPEYHEITSNRCKLGGSIFNAAFSEGKPLVFDLNDLIRDPDLPGFLKMNYSRGMQEVIVVGLNNGDRKTGVLVVFSDQLRQVLPAHLSLIHGMSSQLATAMANIIANEKIEQQVIEIMNFKKQLEVENLYLQEEIQTAHNYSEIVGTSPVLQKVFKLVSNVASSSSSVLILGETGTGKELIARAIHNASPRKDKPMVKVNCATLPANLIESELFGHERGSFTGATERRVGKFELANNGTLFLDEIGEMPLDLQVKLLRALQEKEIERVGGRTVIKTDVRVIAATNRDLEKEVQGGSFRSDLYFRLNVFPIFIPPLRERKEDIAMLASHFLSKHAKKAGKKVIGFSSKVLKELNAYNWPGNVRELEHLVERSILLTSQPIINQMNLPSVNAQHRNSFLSDGYVKTIDELEREHIMQVLQMCKGKVAGPGGAAEVLRLPSTTLNSKIKKLGIKKEYLGD